MKKILASVAAVALAVSAMSVAAFAEEEIGSFNIWISGATNVDGEDRNIWDGPGSGTGCDTDKIAVSASGEYTVTLSVPDGWVYGENNFMMISTDINVDAWGSYNDGAGLTDLLQITAITADGTALTMTGTSETMNDSGIRINVFNPWGGDNTHAVPSMEGLDGAKEIKVTVKVTYPGSNAADGEGEGSNAGAGDPNASNDPNKDSADTGVEGVAVVAGLAIIAAGAVVVAKKRG